jgi:SSS family solute:Na+ symporter
MFSAKDEKFSAPPSGSTSRITLALLALILTGLVAVAVYSPHEAPSAEFAAEPERLRHGSPIPPALRGLMIAAFLAAFMSTVGTQLNWARPTSSTFLLPFSFKASEKHYVLSASYYCLARDPRYAAANITSIQSAWQLGMGAGTPSSCYVGIGGASMPGEIPR